MDLYIVLGVRHGASDSEIRRAYRRLARQFHPDINPGDRAAAVRFRQILDAYETLVDPERRVRYDAGSPERADVDSRSSGFDGFDFSARGVDHSATFGDLFAEVLSARGRATSAPERGEDLHHDVTLTLVESLFGAPRTVAVTRRETCAVCAGSGLSQANPGACAVCGATGVVRTARGHMLFSKRCDACDGSGQRRPRSCDRCGGAGFDTRVDAVQVRIPAGVGDGVRVRVGGKGHAGRRGGVPGDLFITVHVTPDPQFRREGDDLYTVASIGVHEAALGGRVALPAPDGPVDLRIPAGTQSGQQFRVRGRGAPSPRSDKRGDLVVEVRIVLPPALDARSKALLEEFGRLNGADSQRPPQD